MTRRKIFVLEVQKSTQPTWWRNLRNVTEECLPFFKASINIILKNVNYFILYRENCYILLTTSLRREAQTPFGNVLKWVSRFVNYTQFFMFTVCFEEQQFSLEMDQNGRQRQVGCCIILI